MATIAKNGTFSLEYSADNGTTWTTIPGVKRFDPGNITSEQVDVTDFDSPGNFREFANAYKEAGEGSFLVNFDPSNTVHQALQAAVGGAALDFRGTFNTRTITFDALVTQFSTPAEIGGVMEATVSIKMTGEPTWANAS